MGYTKTSPEVLVTYTTLYHLNLRLLFLTEKQAKEISKTTNAIAILIQAVSQLLFGFAELHSRT